MKRKDSQRYRGEEAGIYNVVGELDKAARCVLDYTQYAPYIKTYAISYPGLRSQALKAEAVGLEKAVRLPGPAAPGIRRAPLRGGRVSAQASRLPISHPPEGLQRCYDQPRWAGGATLQDRHGAQALSLSLCP